MKKNTDLTHYELWVKGIKAVQNMMKGKKPDNPYGILELRYGSAILHMGYDRTWEISLILPCICSDNEIMQDTYKLHLGYVFPGKGNISARKIDTGSVVLQREDSQIGLSNNGERISLQLEQHPEAYSDAVYAKDLEFLHHAANFTGGKDDRAVLSFIELAETSITATDGKALYTALGDANWHTPKLIPKFFAQLDLTQIQITTEGIKNWAFLQSANTPPMLVFWKMENKYPEWRRLIGDMTNYITLTHDEIKQVAEDASKFAKLYKASTIKAKNPNYWSKRCSDKFKFYYPGFKVYVGENGENTIAYRLYHPLTKELILSAQRPLSVSENYINRSLSLNPEFLSKAMMVFSKGEKWRHLQMQIVGPNIPMTLSSGNQTVLIMPVREEEVPINTDDIEIV